MAIENLSALVMEFSETYEHEAQQMESRVASKFKQKIFKGESFNDDFIGQIDDSEVDENRATGAETANKTVKFSRRELRATTLTWSTYKAEKDVAEMAKDPTNETLQEMVAVMNRKRDAIAVAALLGNASTYNQDSGQWESQALPDTQKVALDYGEDADTKAGLSLKKLMEAAHILDDAEVSDEGRYMVVTSRQLKNLLGTTEAGSIDYNSVKALVHNELDEFMGFTFIRYPNLPVEQTTGTDNGIVQCVAFQEKYGLFGENLTRRLNMGEDPAHNFDYVLHIEEQCGALRRRDEGVVEIKCYDSAKDKTV